MPASTHGRDRVRNGHGTVIGAVETISRRQRAPLVLVLLCLWRWRWELACVAMFVDVYRHLVMADGLNLGPVPALLVMISPTPVVLVVRPLRRFIRDRISCVVTWHRVRTCLAEIRTLNWSGRMPFIVGCFSTRTGEVVWLWMRPGLSVDDLAMKTEALASACWARRAVVDRTRRNAALVRIEIVRREPVAEVRLVSSRLEGSAHQIV
ncbi:hypothetical protein [Kribbella sp.]|uniref:hypothetical protein n=1 Tax=Kribbella sp. TaxID=1871183 RepID=UPI002D365A67|nr:hypothetical protein [Kribbella sp.]HZX07942.1 hypothetical protein [Kribbella sp.]